MKIYKLIEYCYEPYEEQSVNDEMYFLQRENALKFIEKTQKFYSDNYDFKPWHEITEDGRETFGLWGSFFELSEHEVKDDN